LQKERDALKKATGKKRGREGRMVYSRDNGNNDNRKKSSKLKNKGYSKGSRNRSKDESSNSFIRFLKYVKPYWFMIVLAALGGIIKFTMPMVFPQIMSHFIDDVLPADSGMTREQQMHELVFWTLVIIGLYLFVWVPGTLIRHYYAGKMGHMVTFDLRYDLYLHIQRMSAKYYKNNQSGGIVSRLMNDIALAQNMVGNALTTIWMDGAILIVLLVIMIKMDIVLTLVSLSIFPFYILATKKLGRLVKDNSRLVQDEIEKMTGSVQEKISGYAVVQAFARERFEKLRFFKMSRSLLDHSVTQAKLHSINITIVGLLTALAPIVVVFVAGISIINKRLSIGEMVVFYTYLGQFYMPINRFSELNVVFSTSMAALDRIFEVFDTEPDVTEKPDAIECCNLKGEIEFRNVTFSYDGENKVLKNINLKIKPGQKVAIVGPSGSGKSTMISLLPRFYDPDEGSILIDGVDIRDYKLSSLRKNIGMVLQDTILFSGTLEENIRYGNPKASQEEIEEAVKASNSYDFINNSPYKLETQVGEGGLKLSGGQKQRISIARVFVKNPKILILDEATSALDSESESQIQQALERLMKNRTSIVIAHRLSTIINSDVIVVIDNGEIKEMGSHKQLLQQNGIYKHLYDRQFKDVQNLHEAC